MNILTADDATFAATIGHWSPGVFGPAFGVTVNRVVPGTPPPSGAGHVAQILAAAARDEMAAGVTPQDIGGSPTFTVPSVYAATEGGTYTFDTVVFMATPGGIPSASIQSLMDFIDASGALIAQYSSGYAVVANGDPWTALPTNTHIAPTGTAWVSVYVDAAGTGNFLGGDAVLFSDNTLDESLPTPPVIPKWRISIIS